MKHIILFFTLFFSLTVSAQGIEFFHGTWEEAVSKAQAEEKLIFVDAYATWCGPCKRMAKTVFTDSSVGEYYNQKFVNLKIDMEKPMGRDFGDKFPVSAYPTLFYINEKGELLKKVTGGRSVPQFLALGQEVAGSYDRSGDLAILYEAGNRDYDLVLKYVKALNNANKSSTKIANQYLREHKDLSEEQKAEFLYEALNGADSRLFTLFIKNRSAIESLKGKEAVKEKIQAACERTLLTAIDFESEELLNEAKLKMSTNYSEKSKEFEYTANYTYAKAMADMTALKNSAIVLAKYKSKANAEELNDICAEVKTYQALDPDLKEVTEEIAKLSADKNDDAFSHFQYAQALMDNDKKKKAIKSAKTALKKSDDDVERKLITNWISSYQ